MNRKVLCALVFAVALLVFSNPAKAETIGPDCGSCNGATYTLSFSGDPSGSTLLITYTIDTSLSGFELPDSFIDEVGFKVSSGGSSTPVASVTLVSAPGGVSNWNLTLNVGVNANGCSNGGGGFVCADAVDYTQVATGGVLTWVFQVTNSSGADWLDQASIKARFVDENGTKVGSLVSEPITFVPEPATLTLLGTGLLGVAGMVRRKRRA